LLGGWLRPQKNPSERKEEKNKGEGGGLGNFFTELSKIRNCRYSAEGIKRG